MAFDLSSFRLNSPLGKRLLALVREGNYAHPGEEEAIRKTLEPFAGNAGRRWLDAGCGRGGTAAFVQKMGWAEVTALDIDAVSIGEARQTYSSVHFYECGILDAPAVIPGTFDLLYSFNAFYAFPDQAKSLGALRALADSSGRLVLFDYIDRGGFYDSAFSRLSEAAHWRPIDEKRIAEESVRAGWEMEGMENIDRDYERWYAWLAARFDALRDGLTETVPAEAVDHARHVYSELLNAIRSGALGGTIVTMRAR